MPAILIVDRTSDVKQYNAKTCITTELYKKAGFKSNEGFRKHAEWEVDIRGTSCTIELYGKTTGRAGQENKYEFPPPVDTTLFFGSCVLVCKRQDVVIDIYPKDWEKIYEQLYGGFDDVSSNDSEEETESEEDENVPKTKDGYMKDGFIVDDDDCDSEYSDPTSDDIPVVSTKTKTKPSKKNSQTNQKTSVNTEIPKPSKNTRKKTVSGSESASLSTTTAADPKSPMTAMDETNASGQMPENIKLTFTEDHDVSPDEIYLSCTDELVEEAYI